VAEIVDQFEEDLREEFEERAGIVEYDGNVARAHAECLALLIVLQHHPEAIVGLIVLEMRAGGETYWVLTNDRATARTYVSERGGLPTSLRALVDKLKAQSDLVARLAPVSFGIPS
jgi:hypothetical protein